MAKRDLLQNAALGQQTARRNAQAEAENNARMAVIDTPISAIDNRLSAKFPDYVALASLAPLSVEEACRPNRRRT